VCGAAAAGLVCGLALWGRTIGAADYPWKSPSKRLVQVHGEQNSPAKRL
jgi:hypothetical protein